MKKLMLINLVLILAFFQLLTAGDVSKIGTASGTQLLIPVGARSISLGSSVVSNVKGAEAIHWNPAGMAFSPKSEIMFSTMQYIANIDVNYLAGVFNGGNIGCFGLNIKSLSFGDIEETTVDQPEGTGRTYSPSFTTFGLSYGRLLTDRITAGVTAKFIYESIMQTKSQTFAFDMGVQYAFNPHLRMGVTLMNLGGKLQYDGRNLESSYPIPGAPPTTDNGYFRAVPLASDIPSTFSFGFSYLANVAEMNNVELNAAFTNFNESSDQLYGGLEYGFKDLIFLRGGYLYNLQSSDESIFGFSAGAGLKYSLGNMDFYLDYAYRQLTDYFDASNIFCLKFGL
jgi:hypothetical protein